MALRIARSLGQARRIDLAYGTSITFRPFTFAEWKEVEATATRLAREARPLMLQAEAEALDDEDLPPDHEDQLQGAYFDQLLRLAVVRFATGWEGLEGEDGNPAPLTMRSVGDLLDMAPGIAVELQRRLLQPMDAIVSEGKGCAPSQSTDTAAG